MYVWCVAGSVWYIFNKPEHIFKILFNAYMKLRACVHIFYNTVGAAARRRRTYFPNNFPKILGDVIRAFSAAAECECN